MSTPCPCGSGDALETCCGPVIAARSAATAEQLMRSRYTAFTLLDDAYLMDTWHPDSRPRRLRLDPKQQWLGLKIKGANAGGPGDTSGTVDFVARYKVNGKGHRLHELSRFALVDGRWLYVDGDFPDDPL